MGASGPAIFDDDVACDVRATFHTALSNGLSLDMATFNVLTRFNEHLSDVDDGLTVWIALAYLQLEQGRVQKPVRSQVLRLIRTGDAMHRWEDADPDEVLERRSILDNLAAQLESPSP